MSDTVVGGGIFWRLEMSFPEDSGSNLLCYDSAAKFEVGKNSCFRDGCGELSGGVHRR